MDFTQLVTGQTAKMVGNDAMAMIGLSMVCFRNDEQDGGIIVLREVQNAG